MPGDIQNVGGSGVSAPIPNPFASALTLGQSGVKWLGGHLNPFHWGGNNPPAAPAVPTGYNPVWTTDPSHYFPPNYGTPAPLTPSSPVDISSLHPSHQGILNLLHGAGWLTFSPQPTTPAPLNGPVDISHLPLSHLNSLLLAMGLPHIAAPNGGYVDTFKPSAAFTDATPDQNRGNPLTQLMSMVQEGIVNPP